MNLRKKIEIAYHKHPGIYGYDTMYQEMAKELNTCLVATTMVCRQIRDREELKWHYRAARKTKLRALKDVTHLDIDSEIPVELGGQILIFPKSFSSYEIERDVGIKIPPKQILCKDRNRRIVEIMENAFPGFGINTSNGTFGFIPLYDYNDPESHLDLTKIQGSIDVETKGNLTKEWLAMPFHYTDQYLLKEILTTEQQGEVTLIKSSAWNKTKLLNEYGYEPEIKHFALQDGQIGTGSSPGRAIASLRVKFKNLVAKELG